MSNEIAIQNQSAELLPAQLIESYRQEELERRFTATPKDIVRQRPGKQGQVWDYITRLDAMEWLDKHYPKLWSFRIVPDSFQQFVNFVYVLGELTIIDPRTGLQRTVQSYGCDEGETKKNSDELVELTYLKNAEADALKRCCVYLGAFNDVYSDDKDYAPVIAVEETELDWFLNNVLAQMGKKYRAKELEARAVFMTLYSFMKGDLTRDKLVKTYLSNN